MTPRCMRSDQSMTAWCGAVFFFSSRRRHTRFDCDWSSDVCSSDLILDPMAGRGTTLQEAWLAGHNGYGVELDVKAVEALAAHMTTWLRHKRSEERRVGKECRSRWSPYH